jgi:hypothetical protein
LVPIGIEKMQIKNHGNALCNFLTRRLIEKRIRNNLLTSDIMML